MRDGKQILPDLLGRADVSLTGEILESSACSFIDQLKELSTDTELVVFEVTTPGGNAELARRIVLEIQLARKRFKRLVFVGKTQVYSAGITIMSAFPKRDRFLSEDCSLLIHCRQLDKTVEIAGAMRSSLPKVQALAKQMKVGLAIEEDNFKRLIEGSNISLDELLNKAVDNWYLTAAEARERGLVAGVL